MTTGHRRRPPCSEALLRAARLLLATAAVIGTAATLDAQQAPSGPPRFAPGLIPDRVILTWNGDPLRTQAVSWRTAPGGGSPQAQIARSTAGPEFVLHAKTVPGTSTVLDSDGGRARCHAATFRDLEPGTAYVYRVGDGLYWSEWFRFRTPDETPAPFTFLYFGDAQNDIRSHWSRVLREAVLTAPHARFLLHAGDLVDAGSSDGLWGEWHAAGGWVNGTIPCVPVVGNHEYTGGGPDGLTLHWPAQFALPMNGPPGLEATVYHLDFPQLRLVALDSNRESARQAAWLDALLARDPRPWTVVSFHHPLLSPAGRDNPELRAAWQPVFDRHRVDLVLQGHDHTYARGRPERLDGTDAAARTASPGEAASPVGTSPTVYVVSVSGPKLYAVQRGAWVRRAAQGVQLFQIVTLEGDRLSYEARTADGRRYDAFELRKRPGAPNELVEGSDLGAERLAPVPVVPPDPALPYVPTGEDRPRPRPAHTDWPAFDPKLLAVVLVVLIALLAVIRRRTRRKPG